MRLKSYHLAIRSLFIALIIVQVSVPMLGYIPLGIINIAFIQVTVVIASCLLGTTDGVIMGFTWGLTKFLIALTAPQSIMDTLVFNNPIITIIPRMLIGLTSGILYQTLRKHHSLKFSAALAGLTGSLTNTFGVLLAMYLLKAHALASIYHTSSNALLPVFESIITINGIPEAIVSTLLVPIFVNILTKKIKKN